MFNILTQTPNWVGISCFFWLQIYFMMKGCLTDFNSKVDRNEHFRPTTGKSRLHEKSKNNGERLNCRDFKNLLKKKHILWTQIYMETPDSKKHNQRNHVLVDRPRHANIMDLRLTVKNKVTPVISPWSHERSYKSRIGKVKDQHKWNSKLNY